MTILDGKQTAADIRSELKQRTQTLKEKYGKTVGLAVVLIGENPASQIYVRNKIKACEEAGIRSFAHYLPAETTQQEANALIQTLASNDQIHGILVQLPLPAHLNEDELLSYIPTEKDVDGFSPENIGRLALKKECSVACTPFGVMELLKRYQIPVAGKKAVVVGRSNIVGRPMALLLLNADATVTICHSRTKNLKEECLQADIIVVAVGKANVVTGDMIKEGAVLIDVGMNRLEDGKLYGDVEFASAKERASYITPVPGGVGPMTIAMLLKNVCDAAERRFGE